MWLKLKIKQQFSHNFKIFSTFIFLHREFSVKENKYWLFFKLNEVVLRVMHSCHMQSVVECENFSKRVLSSKVLPGNFPDFFWILFPFSLEQTLIFRGSSKSYQELQIFYLSSLGPNIFLGFFLEFSGHLEYFSDFKYEF